jgi:two-component system phosphate regulon sensor histidine kinase PhoR
LHLGSPMLLTPRIIALILSLLVAILTVAFCSLVAGTPVWTLWVAGIVSASASFLLFFFTLEYLIFQELFKISSSFEKIKKREFRESGGVSDYRLSPFKKLDSEINLFALLKQKEIEELKKIEAYRREFIADLSHELKTPLFAAQGFVNTLLDGNIDEPGLNQRFLRKAARSLDNLDELVKDLLTLSEMETGAVKMKKKPVELGQLVVDVFEQLEKKASKKGLSLILDRKPETPLVVEADPKRIFQAILNLVENAVKYGQDEETGGEVMVRLTGSEDLVEIQVSDNGPGIPEEDQKRVFDRFYRVEKSRNKDKGGSGLGLAIVREIVEAHRSRIILESKTGKGSSFTFSLPRKKTTES